MDFRNNEQALRQAQGGRIRVYFRNNDRENRARHGEEGPAQSLAVLPTGDEASSGSQLARNSAVGPKAATM